VSRNLVVTLFCVFLAGTVLKAVDHAQDALAGSELRPWLTLAYGVFKAAVVAAFAYFVMVRRPSRRPSREPVAWLACAGAILGTIALREPAAEGSTALLLAGEVLALVSGAWLVASVLCLGRCFGVLPEVRGLVTRGPYRLARHPLYLGELGACAGLVLGAPSLWNLFAIAVVLVSQLVRMRLEERALRGEFPEYAAYAARTPALVPFAKALRPAAMPARGVVAGVLVLACAVTSVLASGDAADAAKRKRKPAAALAAPRLTEPGGDIRTEAVPAFGWQPVSGAEHYEFQLAADPAFESLVSANFLGSYQTFNTFASTEKALADGAYYWRVRAVSAKQKAGRWSVRRSIVKAWTSAPSLLGPDGGAIVSYPRQPLVLRWSAVPRAYKYLVRIGTDPSLANTVIGDRGQGVETSGTSFALPLALAPGRYYWAVTPLDADKHSGTRSAVGSFEWSWPTATTPRVTDLDNDPRVFDPQFSWDPIPGAAQYQVEVNSSEDFAVGSRVCCDDPAIGTSLSPTALLPHNTYYWRVRALDVDGNAGQWNVGPAFKDAFDEVDPTIPGLHLRDSTSNATPAKGASGWPTTSSPVVTWDPVPGASSYAVEVVPWSTGCDWTTSDGSQHWTVTTASTAWSPLASSWNTSKPLGNAFPTVAYDSLRSLRDGGTYCVRVAARRHRDAANHEIVSQYTYLGGPGNAAFSYDVPPVTCDSSPAPMAAGQYRTPVSGTVTPRSPLFTWDATPGACSYFVVVARDASFTDVVDVALTTQPAYAPRTGFGITTYTDETTSYYWVVLPARQANGGGMTTYPAANAPQSFQKRSQPPALGAPSSGEQITRQPAFRWTPAEGAYEYRLQVDDDPTFGSPIDDVTTTATSYTSRSTYPADTRLYWRVRANDENPTAASRGLTWSPTGSFVRRLPIPAVAGDNPTDGEGIPVLSWSPVEGAVSYDVHVEQADGTRRDFTLRTTAFTPTAFYGTGVWRWQVRANFKSGFRVVSGGYSGARPFTRHIATPTGLQTSRAGGGARLSWNPALMARKYRVQVSSSDSFATILEQMDTSNTAYAPKFTAPASRAGIKLYWRVAVLDEGNNVGGYAASPLVTPRPVRVRVSGRLRTGRRGRVRVTVTSRGRRVSSALVRVTAPAVRVPARRTNRRGVATFRIRPVVRGKVGFQVEKRGYAFGNATVTVR
jgi:protein-S-isoprenylcysteine O-methyltransferase Ste14